MQIIADFHLHSKYSRATSKEMNIENLEKFSKLKGINLIGTGDFTHPYWLEELKSSLKEIENSGLFYYRDPKILFMLQTEVSNVFEREGKLRKVHNMILAPSFDIVEQINEFLGKYGNLSSDGRPTLNLNCVELVENLIGISKDIMIIPTHAWTPWYGVLGSKSGFDSIEECFEDQTKNIFAIETGLSCYDSETEVLTENGWKKFWEVTWMDKICTLNRKTETIEFQHPTKIYRYNYRGKMYRIKTSRVDLLVTPNHKLAIRKYPLCKKPSPIKLIRVDERFGKEKIFKKNGKWIGKKKEYFILPAVKIPHGNKHYSGHRKLREKKLPIKLWLKFFGFWTAEGHTTKNKKYSEYDVVVSNNDQNLLKEMKTILEKMGFKPYLWKNQLRVRNFQLWSYLKQFGKAHEKFVPKNIKKLSKSLLRIFFDYYIKGDGHRYGRSMKGLSATTSSPKLRDDLQEIALKLGISAYWKPAMKPGDSTFPSGHKNKHYTWIVYFIRKNEHRVHSSGFRKNKKWVEKWVDYKGKVYCVSVPNKIIYVRRNGIPVWCGNSDPPMNWRLSSLDKFTLVSNSDSHSPWLHRLGREANVFELKKFTYWEILDTIKKRDKNKFLFTIEVDPNYGKYHWDGHRKCGISLHPRDAIKLKNICPKCGKKLTIGVLHRVEELSDRPEGFIPKDAIPFKTLLPLYEIISFVTGTKQLYSQKIIQEQNKLIEKFGNELNILLNVPKEELLKVTSKKIADAIIKVREGKVKYIPGYDGVYGKPIFEEKEYEKINKKELKFFSQKSLTDF